MYQLMNNITIPRSKSEGSLAKKLAKEKGEKFYFTNKPCKHGHLSKRFTNNGTCHECFRILMKRNGLKYRMKKYKISAIQYMDMVRKQNNLCAICNNAETTIDGQTKEIKILSVDHCHDTGKIRALLCNNCNQGIGKFQHNFELLHKAAMYCEKYK